MSSLLSANEETTPLRRPEYQLNEENSVNNVVTSNNINVKNQTGNSVPVQTTVVITKSNTNNLNNNKIQVHLSNNTNNNNNNNNNNNSNSSETDYRMDTNKRILTRIGLDVIVLLIVAFPILCFHIWGQSYKRGFFCDDESLKHPFKDSTVRSWMLYIIGLVLPIGVMLTVELTRWQYYFKKSNGNTTTSRSYKFMGYEIPEWMIECYKKIGIFGFGAAVSQLTTDIAKYSIGRLRPHFFAVCQPIMSDGSTCADAINAGKYIENFRCIGDGSTARMIKEVSLSFPSGHSSFTFFTMVYVALYLQSRMTWRGSKLLRHFFQFACIMIAWFTALSRVSDYKHHWSDVLAGTLIGSLCAIIVAKYVSDLFTEKTTKTHLLPRTSQDMPTQLTSNGH